MGTGLVEEGPGGDGASNLNELTDVTITSPVVGDVLRHNGTKWVDVPGTSVFDAAGAAAAAQAASQPLDGDLTALAAAGNSAVLAATTASFTLADEQVVDGAKAAGEPTGVDPATPSAIAVTYGALTTTVTITPSGANMVIWLAGVKYTLAGPQTVPITTANGVWFISYAASGWVASQDPWSIDSATAQVALVYINTTLGEALLADERHGITMDWATHLRLHTVDGAQLSSGGTIADWSATATAQNSNPAPANVQFSLASSVLRDEDITLTLAALPAAGPYFLARRTGAGSEWTWTKTSAYPYFTSDYTPGAAYLQWNEYTGGAWQLTAAAADRWVNYYVFATDFVSPASARYIIVPGQAVHSTLAAAQAESVLGLSLGSFPAAEFAPLYQVTFRTSAHANYTDMPGRCGIAVAPVRLVGYRASVASAVAPSSHSALSNRSDADSHPASAVSVLDAAVLYAATDVEAALAEVKLIADGAVSSTAATKITYDTNIVATTGATENVDMNVATHDLTMDQSCTFTFTNKAAAGEMKVILFKLTGAFTPTFTDGEFGDGAAPTYTTPSWYTATSVDGDAKVLIAQVAKAVS